ncbi:MAG: thiamine-phosphate pyrophosphorylase [Bryobacterales bacterium]|nr:thiamine-phosphate pyrophosphorylase [Bryobacterales bacterium]
MNSPFVLPRLYPILDTAALERRGGGLLSAARALLAGGAKILQIRHKAHWSRGLFAEAEATARLCREHGAIPMVNDRADIAMLLDAGLHVGQDDLPAADARKLIGGHRLLGLSTHNADQIAEAVMQPVDYIAIGPLFATASKENPDPVVGTERFREWRGKIGMPVVAIGGITRRNALEALDAGADSLAVIGDLLPDECCESKLRERVEEWHRVLNRQI